MSFLQGSSVAVYDQSSAAGLQRQPDGSFTRQRYQAYSPYKRLDSTPNYQSAFVNCSAAGARTFKTAPGWIPLADQPGAASQTMVDSDFLGDGTLVGLAVVSGGHSGGPAVDSLLVVILNQTFRDAYAPQVDWGVVDPDTRLDALGASDAQFSAPAPAIKYLHRRWQDADLYFFFNESDSALQVDAVLAGSGRVQDWDAETGAIRGLAPGNTAGAVTLRLDPYGTRFVVMGALPGRIAAPLPVPAAQATVAALPGPWQLQIGQSQLTTPLMTWSALGLPQFWGAALYTTKFTSAFEPGASLTLDLGEVLYSAHVWVNGQDLGARAWRPFTWDVTNHLQPGDNQIVVEVRNTPANELSGDPVRLAQVQASGWLQGSYFSTYSTFDTQMVPSGLMGPVQIEALQPRQRLVRQPEKNR